MIGENMARQEVEFIDVEDLKKLIQDGLEVQIVDVRTEKEYNKGHIKGAKLIPVDDIRQRLDELDKEKKTVLHCRTSYRSYLAYRILKNNGFKDVKNLNGSYWSWTRKI
jgi:rhodanese-related sulfurtransferase